VCKRCVSKLIHPYRAKTLMFIRFLAKYNEVISLMRAEAQIDPSKYKGLALVSLGV